MQVLRVADEVLEPMITVLDFNDAPRLHPVDIDPDLGMIAAYLNVIVDECEGFLPIRGFMDQGQGRDGRPYNEWVDLRNPDLPQIVFNMAAYCSSNGIATYCIPATVKERGQARASEVAQVRSIVCDIDGGNIPKKLAHLAQHIGTPTLIVESGGRTDNGADKLHAYWKLDEVAEDPADLERIARIRHVIAVKVGADTHFQSLHQPIRIPGSVYHKHRRTRLVSIRANNRTEFTLDEIERAVSDMPPLESFGGSHLDFNDAGPRKLGADNALRGNFEAGGEGEQTRFNALSAVIGNEIRTWHEGRQTAEEAWSRVVGYNQSRISPPWPEERLKAEFEALQRKHVEKHGSAQSPPSAEEVAREFLSSREFVDRFKPKAFLLKGIIEEGRLYTMTGPTGTGKTAIALLIGMNIARGIPVGNLKTKKRPVLFLAGENPDDVRTRYIAMLEQAGINADDVPMYFREGFFSVEQQKQMVLDFIAKHDVGLVIVDTLQAFFDGDDSNSNEQMKAMAQAFRSITMKGPAVVIPAHPKKNPTRDTNEPYGGGALVNEIDGNLALWGDLENVELYWCKKFRGAFDPVNFALTIGPLQDYRDADGDPIVTVTAKAISDSEAARIAQGQEADEDVLLATISANPGASFADLAAKCHQATGDITWSRRKVQTVLERLKADKLVRKYRKKYVLTDTGSDVLKGAK